MLQGATTRNFFLATIYFIKIKNGWSLQADRYHLNLISTLYLTLSRMGLLPVLINNHIQFSEYSSSLL